MIYATVALTFLAYVCVGLPLAALPIFVHGPLGFSPFIAGLAISIQYLATVLGRAQVGRLCDRRGPKTAGLLGFACVLLSGVLTLATVWLTAAPIAALASLMAGRLALGVGESMIGTAAITWAVGLVGADQVVRVISWNGVATYGGLALGAPMGAVLMSGFGFAGIGAAILAAGVTGLIMTIAKRPAAILQRSNTDQPEPPGLLLSITPYGVALALAASGFGVITAFMALFYASRHWGGAGLAITAFGVSFVAARLQLPSLARRMTTRRIVLTTLAIEAVGLVLLWTAQTPVLALLGATLTGIGFAPIFPVLGAQALSKAPAYRRGYALGYYSVFQDISMGLCGPAAGFLIERLGYSAPFALGAAAVCAAFCLSLRLAWTRLPSPVSRS